MASHVPIGHLLSRACLAVAGLALLTAAVPGVPRDGALRSARTVAAAQSAGPIGVPSPSPSDGGSGQRTIPLRRRSEPLTPMHPWGFSSEGEPDGRSRHPFPVAPPRHANQ